MLKKILQSCRPRFCNHLDNHISLTTDVYQAVHVTPQTQIENQQFKQYMENLIHKQLNTQTSSVWVHLSSNNLPLIDQLVNKFSFKLHHCKDSNVNLYRWMKTDKKDLVPPYSIHMISCGGIIINDGRLLYVKQKSGALKGYYGIPGGRADPKEGIKSCAQREIRQEIGLKSQFKRILWVRQLSNYTYDSTDIYFSCLMKVEPQQFKNLKLCSEQIEQIYWMPLSELESQDKIKRVGTQMQLASYLYKLYKQGYDFNKKQAFSSGAYHSPFTKDVMKFGEHFLAE